jgi:hypothetical protein
MKRFLIVSVSICLGGYILLFFYREYKIKSRNHLISSISICNNLKVEKYKVFSLSDLCCDYLTDSVNFRVFIDTYQDYESILYECKGDSIIIKKVERENEHKLIKMKVYCLSKLKRKNNFN